MRRAITARTRRRPFATPPRALTGTSRSFKSLSDLPAKPPLSLDAAYRLLLGVETPASADAIAEPLQVTPEQARAVEHAIQGYSVFLHLPTGAGKSLAFQAPALLAPASQTTLVVSPLIALMHDQVANLKRMGVDAVHVSAETTARSRRKRTPLASLLAHKRLVYTTPEFLLQNAEMRAWLVRQQREQQQCGGALARIVLDEAHCLLEWGNTFRPSYLELGRWHARQFPDVPVTLATATVLNDDIARLTALFRKELWSSTDMDQVTDPGSGPGTGTALPRHQRMVLVQQIADRANLNLQVVAKPIDHAATLIQRRVGTAPTIVYCLTRREAEDVCLQLVRVGCHAGVYHGGLPRKRREFVRKQWMGGQLSIICATSAFGMGIDRPDVRFVVHHSLPLSLTSYYQQIGRAGRDGQPAECLLLYAAEDKTRANAITTERTDLDGMTEPTAMATGSSYVDIEEVATFCETETCRREFLFSHFGYSFLRGATTASCTRSCNCGPLQDVSSTLQAEYEAANTHPISLDIATESFDEPSCEDDAEPSAMQVEYSYQRVLAESRKLKLPKREALSRRAVREILKVEPSSMEEMAMIRGVGMERAMRYFYTFSFR